MRFRSIKINNKTKLLVITKAMENIIGELNEDIHRLSAKIYQMKQHRQREPKLGVTQSSLKEANLELKEALAIQEELDQMVPRLNKEEKEMTE